MSFCLTHFVVILLFFTKVSFEAYTPPLRTKASLFSLWKIKNSVMFFWVCLFYINYLLTLKMFKTYENVYMCSSEPVKPRGPGGPWPPTFFQSKKKKINNNNHNKLKIHNVTPWIGQSICYYLNFMWFSPFVYVCKAHAFFSCYCYRIQLFYLYKTW